MHVVSPYPLIPLVVECGEPSISQPKSSNQLGKYLKIGKIDDAKEMNRSFVVAPSEKKGLGWQQRAVLENILLQKHVDLEFCWPCSPKCGGLPLVSFNI